MSAHEQIAAWERLGAEHAVGGERVVVVDVPVGGPAAGPPLLVIHGFPTSSIDFAGVLPELRVARRVVLLDLPGFGLSAKPDRPYSLFAQADVVEQVAADLGLGDVDLLTHDMGDSVGGELLARSLEGRCALTFHRRVLTNGSVYLDLAHLTDGQRMLAGAPDAILPAELAPTTEGLIGALTATMAPGAASAAPVLEAVTAAAMLVTRDGGNRLLARLVRYIAERREHEARWTGAIETHPSALAIVWGDLDPIADWAMTDRLVQRRGGVTRHRLAGVGHYPMLEAPTAYSSAVLAGL